MIKQRQFYVLKFKSSRLKDSKYNITIDCDKARLYKELIALGDNQILKTLRTLTNKDYDFEKLDKLIKDKKEIMLSKPTKDKSKKDIEKEIKNIQKQIDDIKYMPEYVSVVIEDTKHYDRIFKSGFKINDKKYKRLSCSASQARVNTVIFVQEEYFNPLKKILNNGIKDETEIVPNKYNAYFGLNSSSIYEVRIPRVCVIPDKEIKMTKKVDFITENAIGIDDDVEELNNKELIFNLFDGEGIISVDMAKQWAEDLKIFKDGNKDNGLDYIPSYFIVRSSWVKGALFTIDFHKFAKEVAKKTHITDIYNDEIPIDKCDIILTKSQFKLWSSYNNWGEYVRFSEQNDIKWGVTRVAPKKVNDSIRSNYQFNQTLSLTNDEIKELCKPTVDWVEGVLKKNSIYTTLFLAGNYNEKINIKNVMESIDNPYIKAIMYNEKMMEDNYIQKKVKDDIKKKIKQMKIGKIWINGNFQMMCADIYALCEHAFGMEVRGLLNEDEYYSKYWNNKNVKLVDGLRSPLTFFSEHNIMDLKQNDQMDEWYQYQNGTIIYNVWGTDCILHADSDFDGDIVCTTDNKYFIKGVRREFLPITYDKKNVKKDLITEELLQKADKKSFFTGIGTITNYSTSFYAMLDMFEEDTREYKEIMKRLKLLRKEQGNQIDMAKGVEVKPFNKDWFKYSKIEKTDTQEEILRKEFNNSILADKKPYFMYYLYPKCKKVYDDHIRQCDNFSQINFGLTMKDLLVKDDKDEKEIEHISYYYDKMPLLISNCVMNQMCRYFEELDKTTFKIEPTESKICEETYNLMIDKSIEENKTTFNKVKKIFEAFTMKKTIDLEENNYVLETSDDFADSEDFNNYNCITDYYKKQALNICPNIKELANYAVKLDYVNKNSKTKDFVWKICSEGVLRNIKENSNGKVKLPIALDSNYALKEDDEIIEYLGKKYKVMEVGINGKNI